MDKIFQEPFEGDVNRKPGRRLFLKKLSVLAGGAVAAVVLPDFLAGARAGADLVPAEDPGLQSGFIAYPGATGEIKAYLSGPRGAEKTPGVVVVHENRGLNPHIRDVARRLAREGFLALAPDALSPLGGTPDDSNAAVELIKKLDPGRTLGNFIAAVKYLDATPRTAGRVGVVGFCWGGAMANQLAVHCPELDAAVPYYGRRPDLADVPKIKASLLLHYAGRDDRINQDVPDYEKALKAAGVDYRIYFYEGAQHAFNNDANPDRYNREAAELAWGRTIAFLRDKLKKT
ncbi:MAG: dienelactone hydrolase family protein [Pseudomonadota bacterium]